MKPSPTYQQVLDCSDARDYVKRLADLIDLLSASDELGLAAEQCEKLLSKAVELQMPPAEEHRLTCSLVSTLLTTSSFGAAQLAAQRLLRLNDALETPSHFRAIGLALASRAATRSGQVARALTLANAAEREALATGHARSIGEAKRAQASANRGLWRLDLAAPCYEQALRIFETLGREVEATAVRSGLTNIMVRQRRFQAAIELLESAPGPSRVEEKCIRWTTLGICHLYRGHLSAAAGSLLEAERLARQRGQTVHRAVALCLLAELARRQGDLDTAKSRIEEALTIDMPEAAREHTICIEYAGKIEADRGNRTRALSLFQKALAIEEKANPKSDTVSECLRHIADNLIAQGKPGKAIDYAKRCLDLSRTNYEAIEVAAANRALANAQSALKKPEEAESLFEEAIAGFRAVEEVYELGIALHDLAVHRIKVGFGDVQALLTEAEAIFNQLESPTWVERVQKLRADVEANPTLDAAAQAGAPSGKHDRSAASTTGCRFVTSDPGLLQELQDLVPISRVDIPVLITGERGTGKEVFAQEVHRLSGRPGALIPLNCAAIPAHLQEATFFGHARGSFTGAVAERRGAFELAENGTLFLDEIGDMSLEAQAKLLRVLEEKKIWRIGDSKARPVSARVVAATNKNIHELVRSGRFRADLFDRLDGHAVELTPLRTRRDDINLLIDHLLDCVNTEWKRNVTFPEDLRRLYKRYNWPGNVRELAQDLRRLAAYQTEGPAEIQHSRVWERLEGDGKDTALEPEGGVSPTLLEVQRQAIRDALERADGNQSQAARILGLSRTTLIGKIKRFGIGD